MKCRQRWVVVLLLAMAGFSGRESRAGVEAVAPRRAVSLDGDWQIEQGGTASPPRAFSHTVAVPGLVEMAKPAFAEVGRKSRLREAFWYRRTFTLDGPVPEVAVLKIHKAQYGVKVYLNGRVAGVLYFCSLGYSRPGDKPPPESGVTCDDFVDVARLRFEPLFEEHLREAFHPVGLMLDFWAEAVSAGGKRPLRVFVVNDRDRPWTGNVRLRIVPVQEDRQWAVGSQTCTIAPAGREILTFDVAFPDRPGPYTLVAELPDAAGKPVRSRRDFRVK